MEPQAINSQNFFDGQTAARNYAIARPDFHQGSIDRVRNFLKIESKLSNALDIACGTGLSTQALLPIAEHVYGTDSSQHMLEHALRSETINYMQAHAELQPFNNQFFDLITVCSGVHWFDIDAFLGEAYRLLKVNGHLVLYDNFFTGETDKGDDFIEWYLNVYLRRFPAPPRRDSYNWTDDHTRTKGFAFLHEEEFKNPVFFDRDTLATYFTTQSNIISSINSGKATYDEVVAWLSKELDPFFTTPDHTQAFYFGNWIKYLKKVD